MKAIKGIGAAIAMLVLILDNQCAISAASEGIALCLKTVVPSLFPFFLLANLLTASVNTLPKPVTTLFNIRKESGGILLAGMLGGFPIGAKVVSQAFTNGTISKDDAERLLPICNQCGPAFIFGMAGAIFQDIKYGFIIWGIQIISTIIIAWLIPRNPETSAITTHAKSHSLSIAMKQATSAMASVCGWIIAFRILFRFLERWILWYFPITAQVTICGLLELANGCMELHRVNDPNLRFLLCALMISFGGICVALQSFSVIHPHLSRRYYFPGKGLQVGLTALLVSIMHRNITVISGLFVVIGIFCVIFFRIKKITVAFSSRSVYNRSINDSRILPCSLEKRYPAPVCTAPEVP